MRITYWTTSCLEPKIEAVSKEIFDLATNFSPSRVFAVSPHLALRVERRGRVFGFHPLFDPLLRLAIPALESVTDVSHVYSELSPWLFSKTLNRKPIVLTVASEKGDPIPEFLERCRVIAVQTRGMLERLRSLLPDNRRLRLIYPGIDLERFTPDGRMAFDARKPSVLLATVPRAVEELESRGVLFLLEVARSLPHVEFVFASRPWRSGNSVAEELKSLIERRALHNVRILEGVQRSMADLYRRFDFTVIPFATTDGGKECPRSLVEAMACGAPVFISEIAPFASFVREHECGVAFPLHVDGFAGAVDAAVRDYASYSANASRCARQYFDVSQTMREYAAIYDSLV